MLSPCDFSCHNLNLNNYEFIKNISTDSDVITTDDIIQNENNRNKNFPSNPEQYIKDPNVDFILYVMDISYFSGKMEMYCRYKELKFIRIEPTFKELHEISKHTGTTQVPQIYDAREGIPMEKRWLRDTTPMIEYLESELKKMPHEGNISIFPDCSVQNFFSHVFEDYADEAMWRPAMYMRWEPMFDRQAMSLRFTYEWASVFPNNTPHCLKPYFIALRQWVLSSFGENIRTKTQCDDMMNEYITILLVMNKILEETPYMLGNYPTLFDFGLAGPMFRHMSSDATPRKIMQQIAPHVYEWVARLWNCKQSNCIDFNSTTGGVGASIDTNTTTSSITSVTSENKVSSGFPSVGQIPKAWHGLFPLLRDYLIYCQANAMAFSQKKVLFSYKKSNLIAYNQIPVVPYRVWCYNKLRDHFKNLKPKDKKIVKDILVKHHCFTPYFDESNPEYLKPNCEPELNVEPPFCPKQIKGKGIISAKWPEDAVYKEWFKQRVLPWIVIFILLIVLVILTRMYVIQK